MSCGVVLFPSIHFALRAEKILKEKGIPHKLIPVPRHLSSDCGVCLRIPWEKRAEAMEVLAQSGVKVGTSHPLPGK